jgi:hypothetical protein
LAGVQPGKGGRKFALSDIAAFVGGDNNSIVTPHDPTYGAIGNGLADDYIPLQAFWNDVIANNLEHDCSGSYAISSTLAIGPAAPLATAAPPHPLNGRMQLNALGAMNEMVRLRNLAFRRWHGGLVCVGTGSASFASRTCLIGTYLENCGNFKISDGIDGYQFALANVYCGLPNNDAADIALIRGSNIGSGQVGNSLTADWSVPVNNNSPADSGSTSQRATINVSSFPSAAIQGYEPIGASQVQLRINGYLYYVFAINEGAGTATIYPWLDNASITAGSGTCEWVFGGNLCTRGVDSNLVRVGQLNGSSVGRNLSEAVAYGSIIMDMETNGAGTEICIGQDPAHVAMGTLILGRYNEGGGASSEQIVVIPRFGDSCFGLFLGDSGAPDLSKCWALGDPRLTGGAINGGNLGARGQGSFSISKLGRVLQHHKNNLVLSAGTTMQLYGQTKPPIPEVYYVNSPTANLSVQGSGEYNRLFGYSGGIIGFFGTGTNGVPTGTVTFAPPAGGTINGGAVNATVVFSGFIVPPLFIYEHTDTAQLTWQVRLINGSPKAATSSATYAAPSGGATVDTQGRASLAQLAVDLADMKAKLQAVELMA